MLDLLFIPGCHAPPHSPASLFTGRAQLYRGIWADVTGNDDLELYDYNTDPDETVNQAENAKYADVVTKLKTVLLEQYNP